MLRLVAKPARLIPVRWRAAPDLLRFAPLDTFTAVYHRPSGRTHLVVEPVPEILRILAQPLDEDALYACLAADFELVDDRAALSARVRELAEAGLIAPA